MNRIRRVSRFLIVGVFNTALDFSILNALVFALSLSKFPANIISTSVAMAVSYMLNHHFVFKQNEDKSRKQFAVFLAITAFGLFVIQNAIIYLLVHQLRAVGNGVFSIVDWIATGVFSKEFIELNFAKAIATLVTMVWNYKLYKRFVFNKSGQTLDHV